MTDNPPAAKPIIGAVSKGLVWLDRQIEKIAGLAPTPPSPAPADMTDVQLHRAIHDVGGKLLNAHGPMLQASFARDGATIGDLRFPAPMPTTVRAHVLAMSVRANDAYGLALLGLRQHATASALGPIRNVAEIYAYAKWLLESPDEKVRLGRAYRLTMNAIDQFGQLKRTLERIAPQSELTVQIAPMLGTAAERMSRRLTELAQEDGVRIAAKPRPSDLLEKHLTDSGGYLFYSLLSNTGVHSSSGSAQAFYGKPGTATVDFDFKGLHHVRAYWIGVNIRLYLDFGDLAAPVLGWQQWAAMAGQIRPDLQPLAKEAERRYVEPALQAMANAPTWANLPSLDTASPEMDQRTADRARP